MLLDPDTGDPYAGRTPGAWPARRAARVADGLVTTDGQWRLVRPSPDMLQAFVRLGVEDVAAVESYAVRWGLLGLCRHGLGADHGPSPPISLALDPDSFPFPQVRLSSCVTTGGSERLEHWSYWVDQARALLTLVARVRSDEPRDAEWKVLRRPAPWTLDSTRMPMDLPGDIARLIDTHPALKRAFAARAMSTWLALAGVRPEVVWSGDSPAILDGITAPHLGTLGLHIISAAGGRTGWAICAGCGVPHTPRRRSGLRDSWCDSPTCKRAARLAAAARYRDRNRAKEVARVRRWRQGKG